MVFCNDFLMGGGLESRCVGRVYGADGAVHGTIGTVHTLWLQHTTSFNIEIKYYAIKPGCRDLSITCAHNIYSRTLSSLEDNLKMASKGRNM